MFAIRSRRCNTRITRRPVCIPCEQRARDNQKQANRPAAKARGTLRNHAAKFVKAGIITDASELASRFGWSVAQMAHDIEHAYRNGCPYCHQPFASMGHGLADVTLDIHDTASPPFYRTNCRWVCATCNKEKQRTPPHLFAAKLQGWETWRRWTECEYPPDSLFGEWGAA